MPRQVRIEYEGAIYHCMARGDEGQAIVEDDTDRERFVDLLEEAVGKTGWKLFAWVLMDNHYHLAIKTPEANLVAGMKWLQNTWTKRLNARHMLTGNVFGGRYKAVLVEEGAYLSSLIDYIHLNPARAGISKVDRGLESHQWGSLTDYVGIKRKRRPWVAVEEGLGEMRFADTAKDRKKYLEHLESIARQDRRNAGWSLPDRGDLHSTLRRGWCFGSEGFREKTLKKFGSQMKSGRRSSRNRKDGRARTKVQQHGETMAESVVRIGLKELNLAEKDLPTLRMSDARKVMLARAVRRRTTVPLKWIADRLSMGAAGRVSHSVRLLAEREKNEPKTKRQARRLDACLSRKLD